jgi:putative PIN family toxin of toxin-antitoxin system
VIAAVIDTNVLIASIGKPSPYRWLYDSIRDEVIRLCITTEILFEYHEILTRKTDSIVAENICNYLLILPNVQMVQVYYRWNLIRDDADDNKFVDCAIAANADVIVTEDRHFDVLKSIDFPLVSVASVKDFRGILDSDTTG